MAESSYRLNAKGCHWGIEKINVHSHKKPNKVVFVIDKETKVCSDFGISQIYYKTAKAFKLDLDELLTNLEYSVEAGAIVLGDFKKRYGKRESDYWVRYNCGTKPSTKRATCRRYKERVEKYL